MQEPQVQPQAMPIPTFNPSTAHPQVFTFVHCPRPVKIQLQTANLGALDRRDSLGSIKHKLTFL